MKGSTATKWGVVLLCALFAFAAAGCAKKQTVKSQEGAGAGAAGAGAAGAGAAAGPSGGAGAPGDVKSSSIPTEKVEGGAAAAGPSGKPEGPSTAPMTPEQVAKAEAVAGERITKEEKSPFEDIHFDFDEYAIRPDAKPVLEKVADQLRKNKGAKLLVEGHCDERGTNEYNMALGERRAEATKKYLVSLGVSASVLTTVSLGEEKPLDPGHDEVAWAKNRRAHFVSR